jgi:hypothetical protein
MRPSDNAPVCSKIMTTIKMVASISLLYKTDRSWVSASVVPLLFLRKR